MVTRRERRAKRDFFWLYLSLVMIFALAIVTGFFWWGLQGSQDTFSFAGGEEPAKGKGRVNILVMGVDKRADDVGRSDTLFMLTVDKEKKTVSMLSVPRDTLVNVPGHGFDKINHAYGSGGSKLTQRTVEQLLGTKIDYSIEIDFRNFVRMIDAIGGVTVDIPKRMYYVDPWDDNGGLEINFAAGVQKLNGQEAIQYVRYRDEEGDIGRVARQQAFLKAVLQEVAQPAIIPRLPAIIKEIGGAVTTNMSTSEMIGLAKVVNDAYKQGMKTYTVPGTPAYLEGISYWVPDAAELRKLVAEDQGLPFDTKALQAAKQLDSAYQKTAAGAVAASESNAVKNATKSTNEQTAKTKTPATIEKKDTQTESEQTATPKTGRLRVEVVNASGDETKGAQVARQLRELGFEVVGVSNSSSASKYTMVYIYSSDKAVIGKLRSLPFNYQSSVFNEPRSVQGTVIVGKDYGKD